VADVLDAPVQAPPELRRKRPERAARAILPACAGFWTAAEIMHATGIPWLDIGLGTAAVAGVAYGKGARGGAGWLLAAGAWTALAAKLGPLAIPGLYYPVTGAWAVLSFCGWRWARSHPAVVAAREKRQASMEWLGKRDRWGLSRTHLLDWEPTRLGERYVIDVRGSGRRASQIASGDTAERIAEHEVLPPSRVRIRRHRLAGRVEISIRTEDPWAKPALHPVLAAEPVLDEHGEPLDLSRPYSIRRPAIVGQDPETGRPLLLPLWDERGGKNISIVGLKGAGKTVLLNNASERVTAASDALLIRVNLSIKGLAEARRWGPACHLTAFGRDQASRALKVLRVISKIIEWRSRQDYDTDVFIPSPEDPEIVLFMDEVDAAVNFPAIRQVLEDIASKGREYGVTLVRAGQRGTAEWTGGANVRANDDVFCIGMINRRAEAMHAAGDLGLTLPDMATYGEGHGGVWVIAELGGAQDAGRTFMLKNPPDIMRIVEERAHRQPDLKPELKAFLGDSYENLLSTDVYAKWARDQQGPAPAVAHPRPDTPADQDWPAGLDPSNPLHALAVAVRDGDVLADDETAAALGDALDIHEREQDTLDAYDREAEDHLASLGDDPLRRRWIDQGKRNDETRRILAESAATPLPDLTHEQLVAHANARWDAEAEGTVIPDDMREKLLALVAGEGISVRGAADALGIPEGSRKKVRDWLERLRWEGLIYTEGKGRSTRWKLVPPPNGTPLEQP
jgi:hypothetical protein